MVHPVTQALQEYEQRLRDLGCAVVDRLQPGLTTEQIEGLESQFGYIQLPLLERICWWNWALEHAAWVVTPDGGWSIDQTRYPIGPGLGNVLA